MRDSHFTENDGILNIHSYRGTHWVLHINEYYLDSYGFVTPNLLSDFDIRSSGRLQKPRKGGMLCCLLFKISSLN